MNNNCPLIRPYCGLTTDFFREWHWGGTLRFSWYPPTNCHSNRKWTLNMLVVPRGFCNPFMTLGHTNLLTHRIHVWYDYLHLPYNKPTKYIGTYMGVSENRGTSKIIYFNRGFHYFHHPFLGYLYFWKHLGMIIYIWSLLGMIIYIYHPLP